MKTTGTCIAICLVCGILTNGCCQQNKMTQSNGIDQDQVHQKMIDAYSDLAIQNAIITQHTLYPYHFVNNSAALNGVGTRDLDVLIGHFQQNPGKLNLQKGSVDKLLYQSRKQLVYEKLLQAGIPQDKIQLTDGMPDGDGMPSGTVIEILEKAKEAPSSGEQYGNTMQVQF